MKTLHKLILALIILVSQNTDQDSGHHEQIINLILDFKCVQDKYEIVILFDMQ